MVFQSFSRPSVRPGWSGGTGSVRPSRVVRRDRSNAKNPGAPDPGGNFFVRIRYVCRIRYVQLAKYTLFDEEYDVEVKNCQIWSPEDFPRKS